MEEVEFSALFRMLRQQKWLILGVLLATLVVTLLLTLLVVKRQYVASSTILYTDSSLSSTAAGLISGLGVPASLLSTGPASWYETILTSRRLARKMVQKHDLIKVLDVKNEQEAINHLVERISIVAKPEAKAVQIKVKLPGTPKTTFTNPPDRDRAQMASDITNELVAELDYWLNTTEYQSSSRQRRYIEEQLGKVLAAMGATRDRLLGSFQQSGVFAPEQQGEQWLQALAAVESQMAQTRAQLLGTGLTRSATEGRNPTKRLAASSGLEPAANPVLNQLRQQETELQVQLRRETEVNQKTDDHPDVAALSKSLSQVRDKIENELAVATEAQKLQESRLSQQLSQDQARWAKLQTQLEKLPSQGVMVEQARQELSRQAGLLDLLGKQLVMATIQEQQQTENFTILDTAEPPVKAASPSLVLAGVAGLFLGLLLGLFAGAVRQARGGAAA